MVVDVYCIDYKYLVILKVFINVVPVAPRLEEKHLLITQSLQGLKQTISRIRFSSRSTKCKLCVCSKTFLLTLTLSINHMRAPRAIGQV